MKNTKQRILEESLRLFAAKGYDSVTVEQISEAVGIKAPSIYKHFKKKQEILEGILRKMEQYDAEAAQAEDLPEGPVTEMPEAYTGPSLQQIKEFSKTMFIHWTAEEFSCNFRRMLNLEQYRSPRMAELYRQYLSTGPLDYVSELFRAFTGSEDQARRNAMAFYGPMFLLYDAYDHAEKPQEITAELFRFIDSFTIQK